MTQFLLGFPRFPAPLQTYNLANEAAFRLSVETLLRQLTNATSETVDNASSVTETLAFIPDNTIDLGDNVTPYRPANGWFGTSLNAPIGNFTTVNAAGSVVTPLIDTGAATDLLLKRNAVTQLTLASLVATFAGSLTVTTDLTVNGNTVLGNATSDEILSKGRFTWDVIPKDDATWRVGDSTHRWSQAWISGSLNLKQDALGAGFYRGINFASVASGITGWSIYPLNTEVGDTGYDLYIQRSDSGGDFPWLTVTRDTGAWTVVGNGNLTGSLVASSTVSATQYTSTIVTGTAPHVVASTTLVANLTANYLGAVTQDAAFFQNSNNQNAGTLPSARLTGSYTGITGIGTLSVGAVPASLVTAGTFGAGDYVFPSDLVVTDNLLAGTTPASPPLSNYFQWDNAAGQLSSLGLPWAQYRYGGTTGFTGNYAGGTSGAPTVPVAGTVIFQFGVAAWNTSTVNFDTTTRARFQFAAAEPTWVSGSAEGTVIQYALTGIGTATTSLMARFQPGPFTTASSLTGLFADTLLLLDRFGSAGSGNFGASIGLGGPANAGRRYAAMVARQTTADADQVGMSVYVHPSATAGNALEEIVRFSRAGDLDTEFMGRVLLTSTTANQLRVAYSGSQYWDFNTTSVGALELLPTGTTPNLALFAAGSYGSGKGVVFVANVTTAPSTTPTGGGVFYVEAGAYKYKGSSGTVTTLAAA